MHEREGRKCGAWIRRHKEVCLVPEEILSVANRRGRGRVWRRSSVESVLLLSVENGFYLEPLHILKLTDVVERRVHASRVLSFFLQREGGSVGSVSTPSSPPPPPLPSSRHISSLPFPPLPHKHTPVCRIEDGGQKSDAVHCRGAADTQHVLESSLSRDRNPARTVWPTRLAEEELGEGLLVEERLTVAHEDGALEIEIPRAFSCSPTNICGSIALRISSSKLLR